MNLRLSTSFQIHFGFYLEGAVAHGVSRSINFSQYFFVASLCSVCRLCINFQELCARLLGMAALRIRFSLSFHTL